ncbi:MAG: DUF333 domain-containing protein [bacterium]
MLRAIFALSLIPLAGCETMAHKVAPTVNNPASANCRNHGGHLVVQLTGQGQRAFCMLKDGRTVDVWEYFRQTNG